MGISNRILAGLTNVKALCILITVLYSTVMPRGETMGVGELKTLSTIHTAAKTEFLEKGFKSASLRNIVKTAGVTTGAFYGYYDSKEELFENLVDEAYEYMMTRYRQAHEQFENLPLHEQPDQMGKLSQACMNDLLVYTYEHMEEFHLILRCSEGTKYARMVDEMVELEVQATHKYYKVLEQLGRPAAKIDERLEHILATGMLNAYFEMVLHEMPIEDAKVYLQELCEFYTAGWLKIMGQ